MKKKALKRLKIFLRKSISQDRLSSLAMLSNGKKKLVENIAGFNNKGMDVFNVSKERRIYIYLYKNNELKIKF